MPTFDVVSEIDLHEAANAVDQANREIGTRFDFKGVDAVYELNGNDILLRSESEFQIEQMADILRGKLVKRKIDVSALKPGDMQQSGQRVTQTVTLQQGID